MKQLSFTPERNDSQWNVLLKIFFLSILLVLPALASIGKFSALSGDVSIIENGKAVKATMQSQIDKSDAIKTGKDGKAQIVFKDNTVVTLGVNSDFAIEEYFQDAKAPKVQFSVGKGTFKALTGAMGKINPEGFKLKTKTATIGIRGTGFMGQTGGNEEKVGCTQGSISVTGADGQSVDVGTGQMTSFAPGQPPAAPKAFTPAEQQGMEEDSGMNEMPSDTATQESAGGIEAGAAATTDEGTTNEGNDATTATDTDDGMELEGFDTAEPQIEEPPVIIIQNEIPPIVTKLNEDVPQNEKEDEIQEEEDNSQAKPIPEPEPTPSGPTTEATFSGLAGYYEDDYLNGEYDSTQGLHGSSDSATAKITEDGGTYYFTSDYTLSLFDHEGNDAGSQSFNINIPLESYNPSSSYSGILQQYSSSSETGYYDLFLDSKMEFFVYNYNYDTYITDAENYQHSYTNLVGGERSAFSSLPTSGIVKYIYPWEAYYKTNDEYDSYYYSNAYGIDYSNQLYLSYSLSSDGYNSYILAKLNSDSEGNAVFGSERNYRYSHFSSYGNYLPSTVNGYLYGSEQQGIGTIERYEGNQWAYVSGYFKDPDNPDPSNPSGTLSNEGHSVSLLYALDGSGYYDALFGTTTLNIDRAGRSINAQVLADRISLTFAGSNAGGDGIYFDDYGFLALKASGDIYGDTATDGYFGVFNNLSYGFDDYYTHARYVTDLKLGAYAASAGDSGRYAIDSLSYWVAGTKTPEEFISQLMQPGNTSHPTVEYKASVFGVVLDGTSYSTIYGDSYLDVIFNFPENSINGVFSLSYSNGNIWTITVNADGTITSTGYMAYLDGQLGALEGSFYGNNAEATGGVFKIIDENGKIAYGVFGGAVYISDTYKAYKGISSLSKMSGDDNDDEFTNTYYGYSAMTGESFFVIDGDSMAFFGGGQKMTINYNDGTSSSYNPALSEEINAFGDAASTYTGATLLGKNTGSGDIGLPDGSSVDYIEGFMADSKHEFFLYYMTGNPTTSSDSFDYKGIQAFGENSLYSALPSDGIAAYASPNIISSSVGSDITLDQDDPIYVNWHNKNLLNIEIKDGQVEKIFLGQYTADSDGNAIANVYLANIYLDDSVDITSYSDVFSKLELWKTKTPGSSYLFGSEQQGIYAGLTAEQINSAVSNPINFGHEGAFKDITQTQTTATPHGSSTYEGFTASYILDTYYGPYVGLGSVVGLTINRDTGSIGASITPDTDVYTSGSIDFSGSASAGTAAYIRDDYFAIISSSGTLSDGYAPYSTDSTADMGYMVAIDDGSAASDYVSWGYWAQTMTAETEKLMILPNSMWIAGEITPQTYIQGLIDNSVSYNYSGNVIGSYISAADVMSQLGSASNFNMAVNFASGVINGNMNLVTADGTWASTFSGSDLANIQANAKFNASMTSLGDSGVVNGAFYGNQAQAVGGSYYILNENDNRQSFGIFKGKR